jgi:dTDP-4-amino-4,6-dideoxygalactose transaminase
MLKNLQSNKMMFLRHRYFYQSFNTIAFASGQNMQVSESVAARVLCLPLYVGLSREALDQITVIINQNI